MIPKFAHLLVDLTLQYVLQLLPVHFIFLLVVAVIDINASIAST